MINFIRGLIVATIVTVPVGVLAERVIQTPATNPIYDISRDASVSVFDDQDNKCYVATLYTGTGGISVAISCLKR